MLDAGVTVTRMTRSETLSPRRPRGRSGWAAAVVAAGTLATTLAACAGSGGGKTAGSSSASSASPSEAADLAPGLLPSDAFGSGAAVTSITVQQLQQGTGLAGGGSLQGAQITPQACAALVKASQPQGDQLKGAAAEVARQGASGTVEVLAVADKAEELVSGVDTAIAVCPQAQVTLPQGSATISFRKVDVPTLGDGSAAVSFTTVATGPGGKQVTVPALLGFAVDGDRLVTLVSAAPDGAAPDQAAFTALLQKAYQVEKDKLH